MATTFPMLERSLRGAGGGRLWIGGQNPRGLLGCLEAEMKNRSNGFHISSRLNMVASYVPCRCIIWCTTLDASAMPGCPNHVHLVKPCSLCDCLDCHRSILVLFLVELSHIYFWVDYLDIQHKDVTNIYREYLCFYLFGKGVVPNLGLTSCSSFNAILFFIYRYHT